MNISFIYHFLDKFSRHKLMVSLISAKNIEEATRKAIKPQKTSGSILMISLYKVEFDPNNHLLTIKSSKTLRKLAYSNILKTLQPKKGEKFQIKIIFFLLHFCSKTVSTQRLWVLSEAVLTSTHNLCFQQK